MKTEQPSRGIPEPPEVRPRPPESAATVGGPTPREPAEVDAPWMAEDAEPLIWGPEDF